MLFSIENKKSLNFLERYLNINTPPGYEFWGQNIWKSYIDKYVDDFIIDVYGNVVGVLNPNHNYKIVLESHVDEICWCVNYIDDNGFIYVSRNGGSDHKIVLSKKIQIHTKNGILNGVFGSTAIHLRKNDNKILSLDDIFIDVGAKDKKEVINMGISIGDIISYPGKFFVMNNKYFVCKGLDNKIGGFIIAEVFRLLKKNKKKLPFGLYLINSVQEEIGLKGAKMITHTIKPDLAIIIDVTHDTSTPGINKKIEGDIKCGLGPVITYSPSNHNKLRNIIIDIAVKNNISYQKLVSSRCTGTDNDIFAYSNGGTVSSLISIPLRYMHTTVEMIDKNDVEKTINLIYHIIDNIDVNYNYNYF